MGAARRHSSRHSLHPLPQRRGCLLRRPAGCRSRLRNRFENPPQARAEVSRGRGDKSYARTTQLDLRVAPRPDPLRWILRSFRLLPANPAGWPLPVVIPLLRTLRNSARTRRGISVRVRRSVWRCPIERDAPRRKLRGPAGARQRARDSGAEAPCAPFPAAWQCPVKPPVAAFVSPYLVRTSAHFFNVVLPALRRRKSRIASRAKNR